MNSLSGQLFLSGKTISGYKMINLAQKKTHKKLIKVLSNIVF